MSAQDERLATITAALNRVYEPCSVGWSTPTGIVDAGVVSRLEIGSDLAVTIELQTPCPSCLSVGHIATDIRSVIDQMCGPDVRLEIVFADPFRWSIENAERAIRERRALLNAKSK